MAYATNSSGNYSGTIVVSPIRPYGPSASIATVFSNEVKGAHHTYETLSERNSIIEDRRDWGMLVTVYNDATSSNNRTYQLKYGWDDTDLNNNNNWVIYNPIGDTTEWVDSVQEYVASPSVFTDGYRYLVQTSATGQFASQDNKIAIWNNVGSTFSFISPTQGQTLRVDNIKNTLFTYDTGVWKREYLNQVRYLVATSSNGLSYSATSISQTPLDTYSYSVYYVTFGSTSSGTVSLAIDGLNGLEVKKLLNNTTNTLTSGDLVPNLQYQLIYNSGIFQTTLPDSTTTTIGAAEDGDYTDGIYTDFTTTTPIGTAVDRFNELLKLMVPASAPNLTSWSATGSFVNGGISFDGSTSGTQTTATSSPYGSVAAGGTFSNLDSPYRLGITSKVYQPLTGFTFYQDIMGVLNSDVLQSTQTPTAAFSTYSFGNGSVGTVSLSINGFTLSSVGLTGGAVDTTSGGATSGLNISSPTSSKFPNGYNFDSFQNRTGTFVLKRDNSQIVEGYNYIIVRHDTPTNSYVLNRYEWVADSSTSSITVTNPQITAVNTTTTRYLSGIEFFNGYIEFNYDATLGNVFKNTYNISPNAITYKDVSDALSLPSNDVTNTETNSASSSITFPFISSNYLVPNGAFDPSVTLLASMTYSVLSNSRRINDSIGFAVDILRTVQGTFSGATSLSGGPIQTSNWFVDTYTSSSTTYSENFDDENYRLNNGSTKFNTFNLTSDITSNGWSSSLSLLTDASNYNGLQVINGQLVYPNFDFSNAGEYYTNPNNGVGSSRIYSNCFTVEYGFGTNSVVVTTANRTYTRWFYLGGTPGVGTPFNYSKGKLTINYPSSVAFVNADQDLTANQAWIELKLPYDSGVVPGGTASTGGVTGWLDLTKPFIAGQYEDGDGCYEGSLPSNSGDDWLVNFGVKGTLYSGGYVLVRITTSQDFARHFDNMTFVGRV